MGRVSPVPAALSRALARSAVDTHTLTIVDARGELRFLPRIELGWRGGVNGVIQRNR